MSKEVDFRNGWIWRNESKSINERSKKMQSDVEKSQEELAAKNSRHLQAEKP